MAESADDNSIFLVDPKLRGIIPLDGFHVSRSLRRRLNSGAYVFTANACFDRVVGCCADRETTWINEEIRYLYGQLHKSGFAHSVEVWKDHKLVGGLYGVSIASAFFGESMFSNDTDGSKLAMLALVARLNAGSFTLFDTQFLTDHLATMGGIEITQQDYRSKLAEALDKTADFWALSAESSPQELWQLSTQTS